MQLKFIHGVCLGNGVDAEPGEIHEVEPWFGRQLVLTGRAKTVDAAPIPEPGPLTGFDAPKAQHSDPKPRKR